MFDSQRFNSNPLIVNWACEKKLTKSKLKRKTLKETTQNAKTHRALYAPSNLINVCGTCNKDWEFILFCVCFSSVSL